MYQLQQLRDPFLMFSVFCNNLISLRPSTESHHHFNHLTDQAAIHLLLDVPDSLSLFSTEARSHVTCFPLFFD